MSPDIDFDLSKILTSITVYPFPTILLVNSQGLIIHEHVDPSDIHETAQSYLAVAKMALLECPFCLALSNFYAKDSNFATIYCKGGQPAEVEHQGLFGGTHTHQVACAPLKDPHFHVKCGTCEEHFFLAIPRK